MVRGGGGGWRVGDKLGVMCTVYVSSIGKQSGSKAA